MMQLPMFDFGTDLDLTVEPVIEVSAKAVELAKIDREIARMERKLKRLEHRDKHERKDQFNGPYIEKWLKWTRNQLAKLSKKKEEILSND